jgi:2-haloacid dehalogenase
MAATSMNRKVDEDEIKALSTIKITGIPDVEKGLQLLKDNGFRLATLTNSPLLLKQQLINSTDYFEQALSIDSLKKYKPAAETYLWAKRTNCKPGNLMIAAHGWDLGASHAGLATCFIAREGQSLYTSSTHFEATDILAMAEQLVRHIANSKQSVDIQINTDKIAKKIQKND